MNKKKMQKKNKKKIKKNELYASNALYKGRKRRQKPPKKHVFYALSLVDRAYFDWFNPVFF